MKTPTLIFSLWLAFGTWASAQQPTPTPEKEPMPSGPALNKNAGNFAAWVVTKQPLAAPKSGSPKEAAAPPATPQSVVFTKTKPVLRVQTFNGPNVTEDRWISGAVQILVSPSGVAFLSRPFDTPDVSYAESDFPQLGWISESKFDSTALDQASGRKVLVFKDTQTTTVEGGVVERKSLVALVDLETRLPVSVTDNSTVETYQFRSPPTAPLPIPPAVQKVMDVETSNVAIVRRRPGRP